MLASTTDLGTAIVAGWTSSSSPVGSRVKEPSGAYTRPDVIDDDDDAILVENPASSNACLSFRNIVTLFSRETSIFFLTVNHFSEEERLCESPNFLLLTTRVIGTAVRTSYFYPLVLGQSHILATSSYPAIVDPGSIAQLPGVAPECKCAVHSRNPRHTSD